MHRATLATVALVIATASRSQAQSSMAMFITGTPDKFTPAIAAIDTLPVHCHEMAYGPVRDGERGYLLAFGDSAHPVRTVSAVWDTSSGKLARYGDGRGDLRGPPIPITERGTRTSISIDLQKGYGLLMNESHGKSFGAMTVNSEAAMKSEHLGSPLAMVERIRAECGLAKQ